MLKEVYHGEGGACLEIYEDGEKLHVVAIDAKGAKVSEILLKNAGEAFTWVKRKENHELFDER